MITPGRRLQTPQMPDRLPVTDTTAAHPLTELLRGCRRLRAPIASRLDEAPQPTGTTHQTLPRPEAVPHSTAINRAPQTRDALSLALTQPKDAIALDSNVSAELPVIARRDPT